MRFISMPPSSMGRQRVDDALDLLAVPAVVFEDHAHEVFERDAPALEGRGALQLLGAHGGEKRGEGAPRLREIARRGARVLREVAALARYRRTVEPFERRRILGEDAPHAHEIALALEVAQVTGVLDEGEFALFARAKRELLAACRLDRGFDEGRHGREALERLREPYAWNVGSVHESLRKNWAPGLKIAGAGSVAIATPGVTSMTGAVAPELLQAGVAAPAAAVELVAHGILLVVILRVILGGGKKAR